MQPAKKTKVSSSLRRYLWGASREIIPVFWRDKMPVLLRLLGFLMLLVVLAFIIVICPFSVNILYRNPDTHPMPDMNSFVTRSGSQLLLDGQPVRFAGANIYWLGLEEQPVDTGSCLHKDNPTDRLAEPMPRPCGYPSQFEVSDALLTAREMGATVVRSHTLGISVGCSLCIEPSFDQLNKGQANEIALEHVDYAIKVARDLGIHLIIPLVDNYEYYHGGKHNFTDWRCIPYEYQKCISEQYEFYTDKTVIGYFERYISIILNHVNVYTGVAYKNDPTILAWEEGNELTDAPPNWVSDIATYLKGTLHAHQLVAFTEQAGIQDKTLLSIPNVDIVDVHYYPMSVSMVKKDASTVVQYHKVFYVGEFAWNSGPAHGSGDSLSNFLAALETSGTSVDTFWSLFAHSDSCNYLQHGDGHTLHYPGDDNNMRASVQLLRAHAYKMYNYPGIPFKPACGTPSPE